MYDIPSFCSIGAAPNINFTKATKILCLNIFQQLRIPPNTTPGQLEHCSEPRLYQ